MTAGHGTSGGNGHGTAPADPFPDARPPRPLRPARQEVVRPELPDLRARLPRHRRRHRPRRRRLDRRDRRGLGTLTARLAERVPEGKIIALERDPDMLRVLRTELAGVDNVDIEDRRRAPSDLKMAAAGAATPIACGNLPYHIAAPPLFKVVEARAPDPHAVVMIQKEMADRLSRRPAPRSTARSAS